MWPLVGIYPYHRELEAFVVCREFLQDLRHLFLFLDQAVVDRCQLYGRVTDCTVIPEKNYGFVHVDTDNGELLFTAPRQHTIFLQLYLPRGSSLLFLTKYGFQY